MKALDKKHLADGHRWILMCIMLYNIPLHPDRGFEGGLFGQIIQNFYYHLSSSILQSQNSGK